jgi:hypothetical protein
MSEPEEVRLTACDTGREHGFSVDALLGTESLSFVRLTSDHVQNSGVSRWENGGKETRGGRGECTSHSRSGQRGSFWDGGAGCRLGE